MPEHVSTILVCLEPYRAEEHGTGKVLAHAPGDEVHCTPERAAWYLRDSQSFEVKSEVLRLTAEEKEAAEVEGEPTSDILRYPDGTEEQMPQESVIKGDAPVAVAPEESEAAEAEKPDVLAEAETPEAAETAEAPGGSEVSETAAAETEEGTAEAEAPEAEAETPALEEEEQPKRGRGRRTKNE